MKFVYSHISQKVQRPVQALPFCHSSSDFPKPRISKRVRHGGQAFQDHKMNDANISKFMNIESDRNLRKVVKP